MPLLAEVVGESVHAVDGGEDGVEVGVDVVRGEGDELAAASVHLAKEVVGAELVGEANKHNRGKVGPGTNLFQAEHDWQAGWEVFEARTEEPVGELRCTPPP